MIKESIFLAEKEAEFVRASIASGRFKDVSDVVRASLVLLQERLEDKPEKLRQLREMLDAAAQSGTSQRSAEEIWQAAEERYQGRLGRGLSQGAVAPR